VNETPTTQAVIFDMDGVLTDSEPLINAAAVAMFKEKGLVVQPADFLPFVGTGENRYIGGVAELYNFPLDVAQAKKRTYEIYLEFVPERLAAFPGAVDLVRRCRQAGLKVAVASSADLIKINANLCKIGLPPGTWDALVHGDDVELKKPAPDIFLAAARKLGVAPSACVVVEDAVNGIQAAKAAGMRCVALAQSFPAGQLWQADLIRARTGDLSLDDLTGKPDAGAPSPPPLISGGPPGWPTAPPQGASASAPSAISAAPTGIPTAPPQATAANASPAISATPPQFPAPPPETGKPWGPWATFGLTSAVLATMFGLQGVIAVAVFIGAKVLRYDLLLDDLPYNGLALGLACLGSAPIGIGMTWLFARMRPGLPLKEYLALRRPPAREAWRWCIWLLVLLAVCDCLGSMISRPVVPDVMVQAYESAGFLPLLVLGVVVGAPLAEEIVFRGFAFTGLADSRLGWAGATVATALIWAVIHLQYDAFGMGTVFLAGLVLGVARWKTQSVYTPMIMHVMMNLLATVEVAAQVAYVRR
jgi:HAD superfamily hydrolase (TIGR01509 family)